MSEAVDTPNGTDDDRMRAIAAQMAGAMSDEEEAERQEAAERGEWEPEPKEAEDPEPEDKPDDEEKPETKAADQPRKFRVKVDDNETEVDEAELIAGYQRHADYTRKTQALAEERKSAAEKARSEYEQRLKATDDLLRMYAPVRPDPAMLDRTSDKFDPDSYHLLERRWQDHQSQQEYIRQERQKLAKDEEAKETQAFEERKAAEEKALLKAIPEWSDAKVRDEETAKIKALLKNIGAKDSEIDGFMNHHLNSVLARLAMKQAGAEDRKAIAEKKVRNAPPVVKPGNAQDESGESDKIKKLRAQLKKNPRDDRIRAALWTAEDEAARRSG